MQIDEAGKENELFIVALPIGNANDISQRAREVLSHVDIVAAEDTRKAKDWFQRCGIKAQAKILSMHSHNEKASSEGIVSLLQNGKSVALVSDAGTPRISDPGFSLIKAAHEHKIPVKPIPGPSAITALVSIVPLKTEPLLFLGFLSPKTGTRANQLKKYIDFRGAVVFYESVHRIEKLLAAVLENWGNYKLFIGREMTKIHEEYFLGDIKQALVWVRGKKGEFTILVEKKA